MENKAIEMLKAILNTKYTDRANIYTIGSEEIGGITYDDIEIKIKDDIKCLLDYNNNRLVNGVAISSKIDATLFLNNDIYIPLNSTIIVNRLGKEYKFKSIALARVYETHQEIDLELIENA